jgi:DNA-binding CsgD family transcriptional regulator
MGQGSACPPTRRSPTHNVAAANANGPPRAGQSLTPTEQDVVRRVEEGMPNKHIATSLFISPRTVQSHLTHIYAKLGVTSRVQLVQEAARHT